MTARRVVIAGADMLTAYGRGIDACWNGLCSRQTAIARTARFDTSSLQSDYAACVDGLTYHAGESLVLQMLRRLLDGRSRAWAGAEALFLATTTGEIDLLEHAILRKQGDPGDARLDVLLEKVRTLTDLTGPAYIVSAACASASAAVACASARIRQGDLESALVVACDAVTEFVAAGFSSLLALDPAPARPFDAGRKGLTIGDGAGYVLLTTEDRARANGCHVLGEVAGWGLSNDANHMTGPSRDGAGLADAIHRALESADIPSAGIGSVCAHGTGTLYNDQMEMKALRQAFGELRPPVYSIKGGIGHTLGAAGLIEMLAALRALRERAAPPTVNLEQPDAEAAAWVSPKRVPLPAAAALSTNAGFGGINAAVVLRETDAAAMESAPP